MISKFTPNTVRKSLLSHTINQLTKSLQQHKGRRRNCSCGGLILNNSNNYRQLNGHENTFWAKSVRTSMPYHFSITITLLLWRNSHCISRQICMCLINWRGRSWRLWRWGSSMTWSCWLWWMGRNNNNKISIQNKVKIKAIAKVKVKEKVKIWKRDCSSPTTKAYRNWYFHQIQITTTTMIINYKYQPTSFTNPNL